jgi:hypothetical protein
VITPTQISDGRVHRLPCLANAAFGFGPVFELLTLLLFLSTPDQ